jgi:integrase
LEAHYRALTADKHLPRARARLDRIFADWLKLHVSQLAAPSRYEGSTRLWFRFFDDETREGKMASPIHVSDIGIGVVRRFVERRRNEGVGGHCISRDLAALRGALNWAWKHEYVESVPFIPDVPPQDKAPPRDRVLTFEEIAALLAACRDRPEREHLIRFMVIELGSAGRPEAVLQLSSENIDLERGLIDFNQPGRRHLQKRRSIIPIAEHVMPWVSDRVGKIIKYRAPIAPKNRDLSGTSHFERDTVSIKTGWNAICRQAGVSGATPKTLRHTMLTWLAVRGVPREQRERLAGHAAQSTTSINYEHLTPDYLRPAIREVDAFFVELAHYTDVHLRSGCDPNSRIRAGTACRRRQDNR